MADSSLFKGLWPSKKKPLDEVAEQQLDAALERLAQSMTDNNEVCARVRARQNSGSLKLVSIPPSGAHEAE